jgi:hypothetical protein
MKTITPTIKRCSENLPTEDKRCVFFVLPYEVWAFGKVINGKIIMPLSPENAEPVLFIELPTKEELEI